MASSATGSAGTGSGSSTRTGGGGGAALVTGGAGRRTGAWAVRPAADAANIRQRSDGDHNHDAPEVVAACQSVRPRRCEVVAVSRDLARVAAVTADREDLRAPGARRRKCQVPSVRRVGRALIAAFAKGDLAGHPGGQVVDLDVVPGPGARREGDLVERRWRPRRTVGVRFGRRQASEVQAVGADDVDLRLPRPVGGERDLRARRRPRRRRVDGGMVRQPANDSSRPCS